MPVQRTLFGRPVRLGMPPRRFQALFVVVLFLIVNLTFYGPPTRESMPTYDGVVDAVKHPHVPDLGRAPSDASLLWPRGTQTPSAAQ